MRCDLSLTHLFNGKSEVADRMHADDRLGDYFMKFAGKVILNEQWQNLADFGRDIIAYI